MRLQPVAANSLRRVVVRDVQLSNGAVLPAGVALELAQFSVFRNPAWGWEDASAFKPVSLHSSVICHIEQCSPGYPEVCRRTPTPSNQ